MLRGDPPKIWNRRWKNHRFRQQAGSYKEKAQSAL